MEQTGSGPDEASRLPAPNLHPVPLIRIRLQSPPPVPSRESGWGCRKQERRTEEVGRGGGGGRREKGWDLASKSFPERGSSFLALGLPISHTLPFPDVLVSLTTAFPRQSSGSSRTQEPSVNPQLEVLGPETCPLPLS